MKKNNIDYTMKRLWSNFLTSMCQYILFGPIFIIYMVFIPWPPVAWVLIVPYILIPILSAFVSCFLTQRSNFHYDSRNKVSKASAYRLAVRILSVFCFLLIGYTVSINYFLPTNVSDFINVFGEYAGTFESLLTNVFFYLVVAIFPVTYAIVEYIFVTAKNDYKSKS